jgi:hypothetical protein
LTRLGAYGLSRLLAAHGWTVPQLGDLADVPPGELLDGFGAHLPEDALAEVDLP